MVCLFVGCLICRSFDCLVKLSIAIAKCTCSSPAAVFCGKLVVQLDSCIYFSFSLSVQRVIT
jgi:hypothetical protein